MRTTRKVFGLYRKNLLIAPLHDEDGEVAYIYIYNLNA